MKRKQSIYFVCLAALASIAQAQEGKVAIPIEPPTLTYASEFQTTLVEKVHREDSALLLLANRALTNPEDIVLAHGTRMRLIDLVFQEIVLRLTSGCQNAQRTTAIESLGLLIRGSSTGKSHLRFNDVLEQLRQNPEIVSDGESWLTILNHLHVVSTQWIETLLSKRTDLNQLAKNLQSKQTEGESLQQEIEFVEKFAADEAKAAAVKLDDSATYWDEALSKLKGKVAVNTPESFEHLAKADDQYKPIYDNLVTIEKRKRALDLLKIETDTRISKMLLSIYEQKRRLAKLDSEIAKLQEDKTTKTDELKNLTQLFQERTMETRGFLSRFANASSSRVARDTVANLAYALHKASLTYDGPNAFLGSYATTEKPAKKMKHVKKAHKVAPATTTPK